MNWPATTPRAIRAGQHLHVGWHTLWRTITTEAVARTSRTGRLSNVRTLGVDEHIVRHEAQLFRKEAGGLDRHRLISRVKLAAAWPWGTPRGRVGAAATKPGRFGTTGRAVLVSKTGRCTQRTGVVKPPNRRPARTRWIWAGVRRVTVPEAARQTVPRRGELLGRWLCRA